MRARPHSMLSSPMKAYDIVRFSIMGGMLCTKMGRKNSMLMISIPHIRRMDLLHRTCSMHALHILPPLHTGRRR